MPQPENRAWWSDVQHVRDSIERRRETEANRSLRLDARAAARAVAEREDSTQRDDEPTQVGEIRRRASTGLPAEATSSNGRRRPGRRFERSTPERRGRFARGDHGAPA